MKHIWNPDCDIAVSFQRLEFGNQSTGWPWSLCQNYTCKLVEDNMRLTDILSYLFKFKLSFVRELVLFEKWYQEASHTQCLQGSVENLGLRPRFSTPRASPSPFQHFFKPPESHSMSAGKC